MSDTCFISCSIIKTESQDSLENKEKICLKPRIPRPPNAFMLYANENRKIMSQQYPTESNKEISKKLGSSWRSLDQEEKNKYFEKAHDIDLEHKKKYPDYVYNPKEARIRKAMREAASRDNRDRSIGGSPMLARPNARRAPPSHGWTQATHDDLMMSPLPSGMRSSGLDSPCYATTAATSAGPGVVGPFLASGMGYSSTEMRRESNGPPQNAGYMQPNPLTQLHQQTEMWNNFQDEMRPRSSGNPFMMHQDLPSHPYHQPSPPLSIPSPRAMDQPPHPLHTLAPAHAQMPMTPPHPHAPITPPHSNENVPPDEWAAGEVKVAPPEGSLYANATAGEGGQPYGSERRGEGEEQHERMQQQHLDKEDHMRQCKKVPDSFHTCHKNNSNKRTMYLPLSCMKFCASPDLFANNLDYQREYIAKYFQNSAEYEIHNFATEDGGSFPYASVMNTGETVHLLGDYPQPTCIQSDVEYIPIIIDDKNILDLSNIKY